METIKVKIQKYDPSVDKKPYLKTYSVPFSPTMRVLDAIKYIQDNLDGTLSFRWNCGMGLCGSCAMEVNGRPVLTCKTELKRWIFGITVKPLVSMPIVKDLVADYSKFYSRENHMNLYFENGKSNKTKSFFTMYENEIAKVKEFRSCIECFICNDNCRPVRDQNHNFLGPKSIVKAMAYELHPKDKLDRSSILEKQGIWNCNVTRCCQNSCPQGINITDSGIIPALGRARSKK